MPRPQQWGDDSDESATESDFVKRAFDEILKRLERSEFSLDDAGAKVFRKDYSSVLRRKVEEDDRNLLHTLAAAPIHKDSHKWLMQLLIKEQPQLLKARDGHKKTPLYIAITRKKKATAVVKTIWEMLQTNEVGEDDFDRLLAMRFEDDQNCIHAAILKGLHPGAIISLVEASSEGTLCAQDTKGRTPLHLAVDYSRCTPEQLEIVKTLISRGDKALDKFTAEPDCYSVFEYHNYTRLLVAPGTGTRPDNTQRHRQWPDG
ncbi:uncharacterized protein B0T15DRAFT_253360 [Chaetomium strumarium]|uniref:Uncharacterized protein n=1 Tax=Chaetomium strumarium TaxID=1170767 RepID=A0AAJ0M0T3_9PEZI|nr:hypothetical protein B0T15DRAFT_253360 [Chaetomium strumarium]